MKTIKVNSWKEVPRNYIGIVEYPSGSKIWYKEGDYHREDGPAVEFLSGYKEWYLEDKEYSQIVLKDQIILDEYEGKYGLIWYKLLGKNKIFEYPDIPGLITK